MSTNTTTQSGLLTATGKNLAIPLANGVDWVKVYNLTNISRAQATAWSGAKWYWQVGMKQNDAVVEYYNAAAQVLNIGTTEVGFNGATYEGISVVNTAVNTNGAAVAVTAVTAANPPVVTTGTTTGLIANKSIIRLSNLTTGGQLCGVDFTVGAITPATSFTLAHMPLIAAGGTGFYRQIAYPSLFYPRRRIITSVAIGATTTLVTSVTNSFNVGESVRFVVPAAFGMTQLNGLQGTVIAVNQAGTTGNNTVTVNIDSSSFTAFVFPLVAAMPFTYAEIIPVGEDTATALAFGTDILADSTINQGFNGIILNTSSTAAVALCSAGGTTGDQILWQAGSVFNSLVQPVTFNY